MFGSEFATLKASPAGPVVSAATITALRTKPSARDASEPSAMISPLRPVDAAGLAAGFAGSCCSPARGAGTGGAGGSGGGGGWPAWSNWAGIRPSCTVGGSAGTYGPPCRAYGS